MEISRRVQEVGPALGPVYGGNGARRLVVRAERRCRQNDGVLRSGQCAGETAEVGNDRAVAGFPHVDRHRLGILRSEEHTSELQSLMRISYAVFCLKKKKNIITTTQSLRPRQKNTT